MSVAASRCREGRRSRANREHTAENDATGPSRTISIFVPLASGCPGGTSCGPCPEGVMSAVFATSANESDLPRTPERLRHRSEPTLRTRIGYSRPGYRVVLTRHHSQKSRALNRRIFLNPRNIPPFASPGSETARPQRRGWPVAILD